MMLGKVCRVPDDERMEWRGRTQWMGWEEEVEADS